MTATRKSTPKYNVVTNRGGTVVVSGVSKTEATRLARQLNKGEKRPLCQCSVRRAA